MLKNMLFFYIFSFSSSFVLTILSAQCVCSCYVKKYREVPFMQKMRIIFVVLCSIVIGSMLWYWSPQTHAESKEFIPVGILHSFTGIMSSMEPNAVDAVMLAIDEINARGGVLGKKIKPITFDGASNWDLFAVGAEKLITEDKVVAIFGCWTSASRKAVLPILEKHDSLLMYPLQYEGLEESPYIFYLGATVNQQITPGIVWSFQNLGKSFFLVGSDYIYPRASYAVAKDVIKALGGTILGEEYIPLGSKNVDHIIAKIKETKPAVILNNLVAESNIPFFEQLRKAGITPEKIPTMSFAFAEIDLQHLNINTMLSDYTAFNYFQSIDRKENKQFIENFQKRYGKERLLSDYMAVAYFGVYLWAQAVEEAQTTDPRIVRKHMPNQSFNSPEGIVSIDSHNQHAWRTSRIGKIQSDGQYGIVWTSERPIEPVPYPPSRTKEEWNALLQNLYETWGKKWSA